MIEVKIMVDNASELNQEIAVLAQKLNGEIPKNVSISIPPLHVSDVEEAVKDIEAHVEEGLGTPVKSITEKSKKKSKDKQVEKSVEEVAEKPTEPEEVEPEKVELEEETEISKEESEALLKKIKSLSAELMRKQKKEELKALLKTVNATGISQIPVDKYSYILEGLEAI